MKSRAQILGLGIAMGAGIGAAMDRPATNYGGVAIPLESALAWPLPVASPIATEPASRMSLDHKKLRAEARKQ